MWPANPMRFLTRPKQLGILEHVARLAVVPLVLVSLWALWSRGPRESWNAVAVLIADVLLAVRWRQFGPVARRVRDPGGSLGPLSKLVMVSSLLLTPLLLSGGEWLFGVMVAAMAVAGAGLWMRWRWAGWFWIAYALLAMADWLWDAGGLFIEALGSETPVPISHIKPLLRSLPSALFAVAVITWTLEWRQALGGAQAHKS